MKRSFRLRGTALLIAALLTISLAGCGGGSAPSAEGAPAGSSAAQPGTAPPQASTFKNAANDPNVLTVVVQSDPTTMDPTMNGNFAPHQVGRHVYETLLVFDENYNVQPWLVDQWEYEDDLTIKMHLREGIQLHNGDLLTAEDVMYCLERASGEHTVSHPNVKDIDFEKSHMVDDQNFVIVTKTPVANQLEKLCHAYTGIYSKKDCIEKGEDFFQRIAGTGPYEFDSYIPADSYKLVSSGEKYWKHEEMKDRIQYINFRAITETTNRAIEAETGGADIVYDIGANDKQRIIDHPTLEYMYDYSFNAQFIFINCSKGPLADQKVREAIWYGLDRQLVYDLAFKNTGKLPKGVFVEGLPGEVDVSDMFVERDLDKAKALLAEAGYPDGFTIKFAAENNNQSRMDVAEACQSQLAEIGITIELDFMDFNAYVTACQGGQHDMCVYGFSAFTGEGGGTLMRFSPDVATYNLSCYDDAELEKYIADGLSSVDITQRFENYAKAQKRIMELRCALPIYSKEINLAVADYVDMGDFRFDKSYESHLLTGIRFKNQ